ncbi:Zn-dependent hydrolase [Shouchella clausii]|uniref:Zn-dependent hydrolase n=1 Tax=Shouchella clausii TaxID=79880 RepID=UPI002148D09E|nr:Zn-dependent hydrolase [Shouchella clausii]
MCYLKKPTINGARLQQKIEELGQFGKNEKGGLDRTTFTSAELAAREWLQTQCVSLGLDVKCDPAANIWAFRNGRQPLPAISFGSHMDTVPNGGMYDGALGVLIALEVMERLNEERIETRHPFALVSFTAEEPNPFGLSTFGSRAVAGKLTKQDLEGVTDDNGLLLTEALRQAGGDPDRFEDTHALAPPLSAYLEVHIEQGKRLVTSSIPVGIVSGITGIYRELVTVTGDANHAGTTVMVERKDALAAAAEVVVAVEQAAAEMQAEEVVATVGTLDVRPNAANIIPGQVEMVVEIRGKTSAEIDAVRHALNSQIAELARRRGVSIKQETFLSQAPVPMDQSLIDTFAEQADSLGYKTLTLGSMAGHDAAHMAAVTRSGMLFAPSIGGKSHCPEEASALCDIEAAANVLFHALLKLDQNLDQKGTDNR